MYLVVLRGFRSRFFDLGWLLLKISGIRNLNQQASVIIQHGVFDDIKDSFNESESSDSSGMESSSDPGAGGGLDDSRFDDSFSDSPSKTGQQGQRPLDNSGLNQKAQRNNTNQARENRSASRQNQTPQTQNTRNSRQGGNRNRRSDSSPNAQAGRPQSGSSEPQLSSQTRKSSIMPECLILHLLKNRNARGQDIQQGHSTQSVAEGQDDLEEIKAQNRQIIELLKRINQGLNGSQGNF